MNNMASIQKKQKRQLTGTVVSDAMSKTRIVSVDRLKKHPRYGKYYTVTARYAAHDADNSYRKGDVVIIEETRPMSARKRWIIVSRIGSSGTMIAPDDGLLVSDQNITESQEGVGSPE